jgi:hypothetical protein
MSEPSTAVQAAIYTALSGDSTLKALTGGQARVFDTVPPNTPFPYLTIGEDQSLDEGSICELDIFEYFATIHVWSRSANVGRVEAKTIAARAREVMKTLSVSGFTVDRASCERLDHLRDPDGITAHSILAMRFLLTVA